MATGIWTAEHTLSTHNHPTRYWETSVLSSISGLVATAHSDSEEGSKQIAAFLSAAPDMYEALLEAQMELRCLGKDLREIHDGIRTKPTALLCNDVMQEIEEALAKAVQP